MGRLRVAAIKAMVLQKCRLLWARAHRGVLQRILSGRAMSFTYAESSQLAVLRDMCDAEERFKLCYTLKLVALLLLTYIVVLQTV